MTTRKDDFSVGEYYHIYNRGTDSRDIFLDDEDRDRFIKLLFVANGTNPFVFRDFPIGLPYVDFDRGRTITAIGVHCQMTNHFHLLLKETTEGGTSKFMGKVLTSYSSYFNKKYRRSGRLFEGTFKSIHVDSDEYLKYLFAYIHLNPIKIIDPNWKDNGVSDYTTAKEYLAKYKYSSYLEYCGNSRMEGKILNKEEFPEYFEDNKEFGWFIKEWLLYSKNVENINL